MAYVAVYIYITVYLYNCNIISFKVLAQAFSRFAWRFIFIRVLDRHAQRDIEALLAATPQKENAELYRERTNTSKPILPHLSA